MRFLKIENCFPHGAQRLSDRFQFGPLLKQSVHIKQYAGLVWLMERHAHSPRLPRWRGVAHAAPALKRPGRQALWGHLLFAGSAGRRRADRLGSGAAALRCRRCARAGELALDLVSAGRAGTAAPDRNRLERTGALPGGPLRTT